VHGIVLVHVAAADAADVTQEIFVQAWTEIGRLREPAAFGGWVGAIARRRSIDHVRRRRELTSLDVTASAPGTQHLAAEAAEALRAIRELPEAYRETLVLRLVEGLSGPEIADLTGLTPDSVRVNLHRGFKLLRERLGVRS
jgi:RNA polymerase sigma-70 factor (ECF subfamily)